MELAAGEHGAAPHRTKILGRLHGPATRDPVEASAARTLRPHVAGSCTRTSADPGLHCQDPAGQALHGPSRGPVTQTESDWPWSGQHRQPGRTALRPSCWSRSSAHPGPATARPRWALVLHGLSRGPVTQTERLARSQPRHRAAPHEPGRTRPTRSNAIPRESGIRLNPPPEILSRPPACHCQARRDTRCTDSPAAQ